MTGGGDTRPTSAGLGRAIPVLVIAIAALLAVLPLILHGYSCGHDFDFHLRSWMEASTQWQHGILKPVWAFHAAWNAGEPRLLFYPPLSWMTGALLTLLLPWGWVYAAFTWLVLFLCGLAMYRLLIRWVSPGVALLCGCLYLANPYMLFCAYERTAYAELMAAAWMPLLLAAMLRTRLSVWRIAMAIALLWLTNAPAAVVGCYSVLLLGIGRLIAERHEGLQHALRTTMTVTCGVVVGLLLDSFYLVPLAWERRFVQLNLAVVPNARPDANYLFGFSGDTFHDHVLTHSSWIGVGLAALAVVCGAAMLLLQRSNAVTAFASMHDRQTVEASVFNHRMVTPILLAYSAIVFFLLTRWSAPVWHYGPELVFMQFPWRFLSMQAAVSVALLGLLLGRLLKTASMPRWPVLVTPGLVIVALIAFLGADSGFREECEKDEGLSTQKAAFIRGDGFEQTDEYTPAGADNDVLPDGLPPARLEASSQWMPKADSNGGFKTGEAGPGERDLKPDDMQFTANAPAANEFLIARVRAYPGWHVMRDGAELTSLPARPDGLIAVPLGPAGTHLVELRYRKTADQWLGGGISVICLAVLAGVSRRRRQTESGSSPVSSNSPHVL